MSKNCLEIRHVMKSFGNVSVLKDINFVMEPGIYGLVGANGAGKSTLINIIATLLLQDEGEVLYNGEDILKMGKSYRDILGWMPQNQKGYDQFSAEQLLFYVATLKKLNKKTAKMRIEMLVEQVGLQKDMHKKVKNYSGGMRQRLMFVQALLNDPKILILDEPTAGLDPYERIRLRNYISKIAKDKIVLIATHVMQDIEAIADCVILMKKGSLVYFGSMEDLMQTLEGNVCEKMIAEKDWEVFQKTHKVTRITRMKEGFHVRYVQDEKSAHHVVGDLEDVYMYYLGEL